VVFAQVYTAKLKEREACFVEFVSLRDKLESGAIDAAAANELYVLLRRKYEAAGPVYGEAAVKSDRRWRGECSKLEKLLGELRLKTFFDGSAVRREAEKALAMALEADDPGDVQLLLNALAASAGQSVACNMAAIEAGANVIDLAMSPLSGGTCQADILVMWQKLRGTDYELDIDPDKILETESILEECLSKYFMPPEATMISPKIIFSPMPGGALTANTQMMRDNKCLDKFPATIEAMKECVAKGGYGTSVTPVSQFYFQQAFSNVMQGPWKKITTGYGNMVLGYFGRTPSEPDPEVVKIASEQLGKAPTTEDVHDINDRDPELGIKAATAKLNAAGLSVTDENIFITATFGDKGVDFLKGNKPLGIRYKEEDKPAAAAEKKSETGNYVVNVDGKNFSAQVGADGKVTVNGKTFKVDVATGSAAPAAAAAASGVAKNVVSPLPGTVMKIMAPAGTQIAKGDTILILEAMKQETPIVAENGGTVAQIMVEVGNVVAEGDVLASVEEK